MDKQLINELKGERTIGSSFLLFTVICIIATLLFWSHITELDVVVRGPGTTVSKGQNQMVQTPESGIILHNYFIEGQEVRVGDKLFEIELVELEGQISQIDDRVKVLSIKRNRLMSESQFKTFEYEAFLTDELSSFIIDEGNLFQSRKEQLSNNLRILETKKDQKHAEIDELNTESASSKRSLDLMVRELEAVEPLVKTGLAPETRLLSLKREIETMTGRIDTIAASVQRIKKAIDEIEQQILSERQKYRTQALTELSQVNIEIEDLNARLPSLLNRINRKEILSPINGIVNRITNESDKAFVRSGDVLMEIVPANDEIIVESKIDPKDIAKIERGDNVKISLTAYDATKFGRLDGEVEKISADAITNQETGEQFYSIDVKVTDVIKDPEGKPVLILPGMVATVEVLAGRRTVLDYFWQPLTKGRDAAFRE